MTDLLVQAWLPTRALKADDMLSIDLEARFEISDGKLEIMTPPSPWHQFTAGRIQRLLERHYPSATGDVPVPIGDNGRRPDVVAILQTEDELLRQRLKRFTADMIAVAVEVISHDPDKWQDKKSVDRDREVKFHEYAEAGIPEYWIVDEVADDPTDASTEIYHLRDGRYAPVLLTRLSKLTSGEVGLPERQG
jgi:Uma2 family endonuclease